ncbi:unnamed protein product [Closterium sp. Naga37s-1]|nr:unnamed protein product [Closterium sp. Naga37s-1]
MEDTSSKSHASNLWRTMSQQQPPLRADQERVGASVVFSSPQHLQRPRRSKEASAIKSWVSATSATTDPSAVDADAYVKSFNVHVKGEVTGRADEAGPGQIAAPDTATAVRVTRGTDKRPKPNRRLFLHELSEPQLNASEPLSEAASVPPVISGATVSPSFLHGDLRVGADGKGCAGEGGMARAGGGEPGDEGQARVEGAGAGTVVYGEDVRGRDGEGPYGVWENLEVMGEEETGEVEGKEEGGEEEEDDWIKEIRAAWSERRHGGSKGSGEKDKIRPPATAPTTLATSTSDAVAAEPGACPSLLPPLEPSGAPERWEEDPVYQGMAYVGCTHQYTPAHFSRFLANWRLQQESGSRRT